MGGILPSGSGCFLWKVVELGDSGLWSRGSPSGSHRTLPPDPEPTWPLDLTPRP